MLIRRLALTLIFSCFFSGHSYAFITPFGQRVDDAIAQGLEYLRTIQNDNGGWGGATGLVALCFLEQRVSADWNAPSRGYVGMRPEDQERIRNSMRFCINNVGGFGNGTADAYKTGACMMAMSVYLGSGGPDNVGANRGVGDALRQGVTSLVEAQGNQGTNIGGWHYIYKDSGRTQGDLSTTQFVMAGLSAAAAIYPTADDTLPDVSTFLGYVQRPDGGSAYRPNNYAASHPMTASAAWSARLGRIPTEEPLVQSALGWLQRNYRYTQDIIQRNDWSAIYYHLWAASKAYEVTEHDGGNAPIYSDDIGGVRNPIADGYPEETPRWYYDFAWWLTETQDASGNWSRYGEFDNYARIAYALLVLERSLGGVCLLDSDEDGFCDVEDNCPDIPNEDQSDRDNDQIGDVCDNCPNTPNSDQLDEDADQIGDACDDLICISDAPTDFCDNIDNDCDGTIDEDSAGDAACATGQPGTCALGRIVCQAGMEICTPTTQEELETCDGYDNDCDGLIDEGVRGACGYCTEATEEVCDGVDNDCNGLVDDEAVCPDGNRCFEGECFEICRLNECITPNARCDEASGLCLTGCFGIECELGEYCDDSTGVCVDPCADGPDCGEGLRCWMGACAPDSCTTTGCDHLQNTTCRCPEADPNCSVKECLGDPCAAVECNAETEFCRDGQCVGSCARISCELNETCVDGACVCAVGSTNGSCDRDPCNGITCGANQTCENGACVDDPCGTIECENNERCEAGACVFDECMNQQCPPGEICVHTPQGRQCVFSDRPESQVMETQEEDEGTNDADIPGTGETFVEDTDAGIGGGVVFNGDVGPNQPAAVEPIAGCQCDQNPAKPFGHLWWMLILGFGMRCRDPRRPSASCLD